MARSRQTQTAVPPMDPNQPGGASVAQSPARVLSRKVRIGPAGWSYPDWAGYVYPKRRVKGFHEATYLAEYFDTIEINSSFYGPMKAEQAKQWVERVAANPRFLFTAKLWQRFTHVPAVAASPVTAGEERLGRDGFGIL